MEKITILLFVVFTTMIACQNNASQKEMDLKPSSRDKSVESQMIHTVYFWFKEDVTEMAKKDFEKGLEQLSTIKSIQKMYWGKPAKTVQRDVTDHSYDYAINVFFKSLEDEAAYQVDPAHDQFRNDYGPLFEKVIVYDNDIR